MRVIPGVLNTTMYHFHHNGDVDKLLEELDCFLVHLYDSYIQMARLAQHWEETAREEQRLAGLVEKRLRAMQGLRISGKRDGRKMRI